MQNVSTSTLLWCNICQSPIYPDQLDQSNTKGLFFGFYTCQCKKYPMVAGILLVMDDDRKTRITKLIKTHSYFRAISSVIDENRAVKLLMCCLVYLRTRIPRVFEYISYKYILSIVQFLSTDKPRWKYFINRRRMPSSYFSLLTEGFVNNKTVSYIDIGCGDGFLLNWMYSQTNIKHYIGVDISFLQLLLARLFVVSESIQLIVTDVAEAPFAPNSIDLLSINDTWQYLKKTPSLLRSIRTFTSLCSSIVMFHIFNPDLSYNSQPICFPTDPSSTKLRLKRAGFHNIRILLHQNILSDLFKNAFVRLDNCPSALAENALSYSLIGSKKNLKSCVKINPIIQNQLIKKGITFYQDPDLISTISLKEILDFKDYIFISPHIDDAILSSGALLSLLHEHKKNVTIISVFTKATPAPYSVMATRFLKNCDFTDADLLFAMRKKEELGILKKLQCKGIFLDYIDAAWRLSSTNTPMYKSPEAQFSGEIAQEDFQLIDRVYASVRSVCSKVLGTVVVFAPIGIGGHADHVILNKAVAKLNIPTVFWEDVPYNAHLDSSSLSISSNYSFAFQIKTHMKQKGKLFSLYKSQQKVLFPENKPVFNKENYYLKARTNG